jgi:hypothetical protein
MGVDFAIDVEPRQPPPLEISEAEIVAHYNAHVPSGDPPLAVIREHVVRAIAFERSAGERDPIDALNRRFVDEFGRDRVWWDPSLDDIARARGVTTLRDFQRDDDGELSEEYDDPEWLAARTAERHTHLLDRGPARDRWCDAADGLRTIRALQAEIDERGGDLREHVACLALVDQILTIAERERRRWRLLVWW